MEDEIEIKLIPGGEMTDRDCEGVESCIAEMRWFQERWRAGTIDVVVCAVVITVAVYQAMDTG